MTREQSPSTPPESGVRRWLIRGVIALVALIIVGYGAIFIYAEVINDAPDELDAGDLSEALEEPSDASAASTVPGTQPQPTTTGPDQSTEPATGDPVVETAPSTTVLASTGSTDGFDGNWVPTSASEFGYRVDEVLGGVNVTAVGRSNEIAGLLTIDGTRATTVDIEVQIANIVSDDSLRDGQFTGRIMNAAEFPTATFSLTEPIDFGAVPDEGEQVTVNATGDLTLRGVTNEVTFELTAEAGSDRIGVLGAIPVLFSDYEIPNPSIGPVSTEDNGLLEFVLVFERE